MLEDKEIQQIKEIINNFFNIAGFEIELEEQNEENNCLINIISIEDPKIFIGKQGLILKDIELLLRKLATRKLDKPTYFNLDIDNYKKNKIYAIKSTANSAAEEVILTQKDKIMPPLSAFERRIIHLELENNKEVKTETIEISGQRRLIIKNIDNS